MDIQTTLPLTEATFFILLSIASEPKHGYAIMQDVAELSDGRVNLSTGTLYGALKRLLREGWIERTKELVYNHDGRERKAYRLSDLGRKILEAEVIRLARLASTAQLRAVGADQ